LACASKRSPTAGSACGGKYELENLYPLADLDGMHFRACVANQIRDLPDGAETASWARAPKSAS
jgi:hypothetical protein